MSQTISNIRPRIILTINRKSTGSTDELRIICQGSLHTHCCRASLLQLGFLVVLSSKLTCSQQICSRSAVPASDALTGSFARYKFVNYLLTYRIVCCDVVWSAILVTVLWRSGLSIRVPGCQKLQMTAKPGLAQHAL